MSLYDKYFTVISIWLVLIAIMIRIKTGVSFILLIGAGILFLIIFTFKNIKLIKPIKKVKKI